MERILLELQFLRQINKMVEDNKNGREVKNEWS